MSKDYLPLKVDPFRFADNEMHLQGCFLVKNMLRLCSSLASDDGDIKVKVHFGVDEQGIRFLRGHYEGCLFLQCQRCMDSFDYPVTNDFVLGIVHTEEEANKLPEYYDPLIVKECDLFLQDVIEDELIVNLPLVSMHEPKECKIVLPLIVESKESSFDKDNPFKVIELLRRKGEG